MTPTMFRASVLALSLLLPPLAQSAGLSGQDGAYGWAGGLYEFPDSERHSDDGVGGWVGLGYSPSGRPGESLEIAVLGLRRDRHDRGSDGQYGVFGHWTMNVFEDVLGGLQPFVLAGVGAVYEDVPGNNKTHFGIDGGVGLLIPLGSSGWAVRTEAVMQAQRNNDRVPHGNYLFDGQVRAGLQIPFGGASRDDDDLSYDEPAHARVVEVESAIECPSRVTDPATGRSECGTDSDGDHVLDANDMCPGTPRGTDVDSKGCPVAPAGDADGDGVLDPADACPDTVAGMKVDATGCVVDQTATLKGVRFETGSARLTSTALGILDDVGRTLQSQPSLQAEIRGHTDDAGNDAYNMILSQQRAESVRQYLIGRGVRPERLSAQGFGETQPVASNDTPAGRERNRRVDIQVRNR